jgi:dipeptide transport system substrate-binding protein
MTRRPALPAAALASALALAGLAAPAPAAAAPTLVYCTDAAPQGFDPAQYQTIATDNAAGMVLYDTLLRMKPGTTELAPGLAQSWQTSADGRVVTLHLRPGVAFHATPWFTPTRPLDSSDVLWSLQRMADPAHPGHAAAAGGFPYWAGLGLATLVKAISAPDKATVRIELARPDASFLADLTLPGVGAVLSAEYAAQLQKTGGLAQMDTRPVGTGPFVLRGMQKDAVVRYAANPAWWGGAPRIGQLVFAITPDTGARAQRVRAGECQVAPVLAAQLPALEADPRLAVLRARPLNTWYVSTNVKRPFLSDPRLRRALALAVDKATLVKAAFAGLAEPAGSFLPPGMAGRDPTIADPHDPARAAALVKASGYDGRVLRLFAVAGDARAAQAVALLQADWAAIGVKVAPETMELGEFIRRTGRGEHDLAWASWFSDNGDPDDFLAPNLACAAVGHGTSKSQWCDPAFDAQLAAGRASTDPAVRAAAYRRAQALLHDAAPLIPVAHEVDPYAVSRRVHGFAVTPFGQSDFRGVSMD